MRKGELDMILRAVSELVETDRLRLAKTGSHESLATYFVTAASLLLSLQMDLTAAILTSRRSAGDLLSAAQTPSV